MVRHWRRVAAQAESAAGRGRGPARPPRTSGAPPASARRSTRSARRMTVFVLVDRDDHQVHARRLARVHRDPDPRVPHDRREPVLPRRRARDRGRRPRRTSASKGDDAIVLVGPHAEAGAQGARLRHRRPARQRSMPCTSRSSDEETETPPEAVGRARRSRCRSIIIESPYRDIREPGRRSSSRSAARSTAPRSSRSTCRSTSSATGGSRSCTTAGPRRIAQPAHAHARRLDHPRAVAARLVRAHLRPPLAPAARAGAVRNSRRPARSSQSNAACGSARPDAEVMSGSPAPGGAHPQTRLLDCGS